MTSYYYAKNNAYMENIENYLHNNFKNFASLKKIDVLGNNLLLKKSILELINVRVGQKLYLISANDIRDKLLKLDEISDVNVNINYSGLIKITINERKPFAIWWNKNSPWLIDEEGSKILNI